MAYTFTQLTGRVNDIPHRPKNQDLTEVQALINESYITLVAELGCYSRTFTNVALTINVGDYDVITDWAIADFSGFRSINYTAASGVFYQRPLDPVPVDELLFMRQTNPVAMSPAVAYAMPDWRSIMLQPLPATGDTVSGRYSALPAVMSAPSDTPVRLPPNLHHLIVGHCACICMEQMDIDRANVMMQNFQQGEMRRARSWLNQHISSRPFAPGAHRNVQPLPGEFWSPP